ncbi:MAG: hypothetical protein M0Q51_12780 [Bacteroidales bacterium]|nr:hypothetical protein [Bacteroidales bacterium]
MKNLLLPYPWKLAGRFVTISGIALAVLYLWFDFRFSMPVFAIFSSFLETKMFVTFRTNFADDLILLLLIVGFGLIVLSKEKIEFENLDSARAKALAKAIILNNIFLLFSILFVYGSGFIAILVLNLFSLSLFYLIFFYFLKRKELK